MSFLSCPLSFLSQQPDFTKYCWHCDFNSLIFFSRTDFSCIISVEVKRWSCALVWDMGRCSCWKIWPWVVWELCAHASFQAANRLASALPDQKYYFSFPVLLHRIHVSEIHSINMESLMENKEELNHFIFLIIIFSRAGVRVKGSQTKT